MITTNMHRILHRLFVITLCFYWIVVHAMGLIVLQPDNETKQGGALWNDGEGLLLEGGKRQSWKTENFTTNNEDEKVMKVGMVRKVGQGAQLKMTNLGINYGMVANNLPNPEEVKRMLLETRISSVKLYTPDTKVLQVMANTGLSVVVGVPDEDIPTLATSTGAAQAWLESHILPFYPGTNIIALVVGNEILTSIHSSTYSPLLLQAMQNLYRALVGANLQRHICVSTTHSMAVLETSFPPSSARFQPNLVPILKRLFAFLSSTNSPYMSNAYPYFAYKLNPDQISLDYALFRPNSNVVDPNTNLRYTNLFDAQVDAIYYAMKAIGFNNIQVVVAESGWPSKGDVDELGATVENAKEYNANLIKHVESNVGTPAMPNKMIYTYIFSLFNEDLKPGPTSERNFGLYEPDGREVYDVGVQLTGKTPHVTTSGGAISTNSKPNDIHDISLGTWCIAKSSTSDALLSQTLAWACGEGGADCQPIQPGGNCYQPNRVNYHASYVMNSYYQRHGKHPWNCDFAGQATITHIDPSYESCIYPSQ